MNTPIDLPTKLKIAYYHGAQIPQRSIANLTNTSKSSVNRVIQIMDKKEITDFKYDYKTQLEYHFVLYKILSNPFVTYNQIYKSMENFDFQISESTISRITRSLNIKNTFQKPKEKLTQDQKINRIIFAQNFLQSEYFLFPMVFSDESMIELNPSRKKIKIIPFLDSEDYFYETEGYPLKIMIWGCVGLNFKSKLIFIIKN